MTTSLPWAFFPYTKMSKHATYCKTFGSETRLSQAMHQYHRIPSELRSTWLCC